MIIHTRKLTRVRRYASELIKSIVSDGCEDKVMLINTGFLDLSFVLLFRKQLEVSETEPASFNRRSRGIKSVQLCPLCRTLFCWGKVNKISNIQSYI
jgi:hypothetical protein